MKSTVCTDDEICLNLDEYFTKTDVLSFGEDKNSDIGRNNELFVTAIKYMFSNKLNSFKKIVKRNISMINRMSDNGLYLLHLACYNKKHDFVIFLLSMNADSNTKDHLGKKAPHYAVMSEDSQIINILISHGIDVNIQDSDGDTPLHYAVSNNDYKMIKTLIGHNVNPLIENNNKMIALDYSLANKQILKKLSIYITDYTKYHI